MMHSSRRLDDILRQEEDESLRASNSINFSHCRRLGVDEELIKTWEIGAQLDGQEFADHYDMQDYPSVRLNPVEAARELDRLTSEGKIHWYQPNRVPTDLDIGPTTLIMKSERSRLVHDWTRAGLNQHLTTPPSKSHNMDDLVAHLWKGCHIAGLDIKDCFLHWAVHPNSRRRSGVRHPITGRLGVYLFLPPGLTSAPGINERFVNAIVTAVAQHLNIHVVRYVDDLRIVNSVRLQPAEDKQLLDLQLKCLSQS